MTLPVPKQKILKVSIILPFITQYAFTNMSSGNKKVWDSQWKDELHL